MNTIKKIFYAETVDAYICEACYNYENTTRDAFVEITENPHDDTPVFCDCCDTQFYG